MVVAVLSRDKKNRGTANAHERKPNWKKIFARKEMDSPRTTRQLRSQLSYVRKRVFDIVGKDEYAKQESQSLINQSLEKLRTGECNKSAEAIANCIQDLERQWNKKYSYAKQGRPRKYEGNARQRYYASVLHMAEKKLREAAAPALVANESAHDLAQHV
jgi:hypothetical protein